MESDNTTGHSFDKYDEPRLHMERLMKAHLVEFDISVRILIPLESSGIRTVGDLLKCRRDDLLQIKNIGTSSVCRISEFIESLGLNLSK